VGLRRGGSGSGSGFGRRHRSGRFGSGWLNNGGSGGRSTIAAQMAAARGLRSWRGGDRVWLASRIGGVSGALGECLDDAGCVVEGDSRAAASGGVGESEAGSGSCTVRIVD
jgi:hypothetical protein